MGTNIVGDNTILVNSMEIAGDLIGGPTLSFDNGYSSAFRADITSKGLVLPGANTLSVDGLGFTQANNGAGIMVIYDDGVTSEIGFDDWEHLMNFMMKGLKLRLDTG